MIMPFGRHRGKPLENIPEDYLCWVLHECENIQPRLRRAIEQVLNPATTPAPGVPAASITTILAPWYRRLAQEFHPDVGGSHSEMKAVNRSRDLLLEMTGAEQ